MDYSRQMVEFQAMAYQILKSVSTSIFTPTERTNLLNYWYNDHPWSMGGIDYSAAAHTEEPFVFGWSGGTWVTGHGTWTMSGGSATVTGSGTTFITDGCAPGLIFWTGNIDAASGMQGYAKPAKIASCDSQTQITLEHTANYNFTATNTYTYQFGKAWDGTGTQMGLEWIDKHYGYNMQCGGCLNYPYGSPVGDYENNLYLSGVQGSIAKGLAGCADGDMRGCLIVTRNAGSWYHRNFRAFNVYNGSGFNFGSLDYSGRINNQMSRILLMLRNDLGVDYTTDNSQGHQIVLQFVHSWLGHTNYGSTAMPQGQEPVDTNIDSAHVRAMYAGMFFAGVAHDAAKWGRYYLNTLLGYGSSFTVRAIDISEAYVFLDPAISATAPPTSNVAENDYDSCVTNWSTARCAMSTEVRGRRGGLYSRSAWATSATVVGAMAGFIPSTLVMLLCYFFATGTGLLMLEATLWFDQRVNLISMAGFAFALSAMMIHRE
jgi:hypothetical protein